MGAPRVVSIGRQSNGGAARLTPAAAASYQRMRRAGLAAGGLTSTYRDWNTQARWRAEYLAGKRKAYVAPPSLSSHCKGTAVDFARDQSSWVARHGAAHGWRRTNSSESWHWVYFANLDKRKSLPAKVPAKVAAAWVTLRKPMRGSRVAALQREMNRLFPAYAGIPMPVNGIFNDRLVGHVRDFQRRAGLKMDGVVGPVTQQSLKRHGARL